MNPKIIATIGQNSDNYETLKSMAKAGMEIARLNFSHATTEQWKRVSGYLKKIKKEIGISIKMMLDLQGPRIRVGELPHEIEMVSGEVYSFSHKKNNIAKKEIFINHPRLAKDIKVGAPFYLANGLIELVVIRVKRGRIFVRVEHGGVLFPKKGVNVPETNLSTGGITKKDLIDARFGADNGADFICLSFVQSGADLEKVRKALGKKKITLIAKIERGIALDLIDDIIQRSDGIMVARGDLGVEIAIEELPIIQKELIRHAHWHKKPAIVATEMLVSMVNRPRPTRAEAADVANAVFDGADAVMLSDETSFGNYPVEAVKTMKKIVYRADEYFNNTNYFHI